MDVKFRQSVKYRYIEFAVMAILFIALAYQKLAFYVRFDFNFILLLIVLPFVLRRQNKSISLRYGFIAISLLVLYLLLKLSSIYFFAFVCTLFYLYEYRFGKLSSIPLFLVIIVSPVAIYLSEAIGFEIRLWLTRIASKILGLFIPGTQHIGNLIVINKQEFHVDAECMGLKMVLMAFFTGLIFITYHQHKKGIVLSFFFITCTLAASYLLVILSNLMRIILITLFQSPPGSFAHELVGTCCFVVYVVIPLWFIVKNLPGKTEISANSDIRVVNKTVHITLLLILILFFTLLKFTRFESKKVDKIDPAKLSLNMEGFSKSTEELSVLKLSNDKILIYLKPATSFYSADHSPLICWKGSGYKIQKEEIISLGNQRVYYTELKSGEDSLYTVWWYDSGEDKTISQFRWRSQSLFRKKSYYLVNVTSYSRPILLEETEILIKKSLFKDKN